MVAWFIAFFIFPLVRNLKIFFSTNTQPVNILVMDAAGSNVYETKSLPEQTFNFGEIWMNGLQLFRSATTLRSENSEGEMVNIHWLLKPHVDNSSMQW